MILIVCVVIKNKLDSRKISNKNPTEKNKARDEKCLSRPGKRSQAVSPGEKKNSTLFGTLSSYCLLTSPSTDKSEGSKGAEGDPGGKLKSWFSLGKTESSDQQSSVDFERKSTNQLNLMRKMCGEFRDFAKLKNKDEREERQKELEQIRGARWTLHVYMFTMPCNLLYNCLHRSFFKSIDVTLRSNPGVKLRSDDDSLSRGNPPRSKTDRYNNTTYMSN